MSNVNDTESSAAESEPAPPQLTPREVVAEPMPPDQPPPLDALELRCAAAEMRESALRVKVMAYQMHEAEAARDAAQMRLHAVRTALAQKYRLGPQDHLHPDGRIERSKGG